MDEVRIKDPDGVSIVTYVWQPAVPRAVVQILHGWAEHARRYDHVAAALVDAGYAVVADDHRGHGLTGIEAGGLGDLGPRGMDGVLDAVHAVTQWISTTYAGVPLFLLGHSWGSFLAQRYIEQWGDELAGVLLTGTTLRRPDDRPRAAPAASAGASSDASSDASPEGRYDWLTRDGAEVQRYIDDPMCGFESMQRRPPASSTFSRPSSPPDAGGTVPTRLPAFIFNGAEDRIGGHEGGHALAEHYRALELADVSFTSYPGARHELFNELNRDEVIADVLAWLAAR